METLIIPEPRPQPHPWAVKLCGGGPRGRVCLLMQAGAVNASEIMSWIKGVELYLGMLRDRAAIARKPSGDGRITAKLLAVKRIIERMHNIQLEEGT